MLWDVNVHLDDETMISSDDAADAVSLEQLAGAGVTAPTDEDGRHRPRRFDGRAIVRRSVPQDRTRDSEVAEHVGHRPIVADFAVLAYPPV